MVTQSRLPAFLLTRPMAQSERFAASLRVAFGAGLSITISPLIAPKLLHSPFPSGAWGGVIFTSETGVTAFAQHPAHPKDLPKRAFCVGNHTAEMAQKAGLEPISANGDALALIALIQAQNPVGPLLHICGANRRGNIAENLTRLGHPASALVLYEQQEQALTQQAKDLLSGTGPVVAPLFSPRTAALFAKQLLAIAPKAPLICPVLSDAVADSVASLGKLTLCCAEKPTAEALLDAIKGFFDLNQVT